MKKIFMFRIFLLLSRKTNDETADDGVLQTLIKEAQENVLPLTAEREQYAALARWDNSPAGCSGGSHCRSKWISDHFLIIWLKVSTEHPVCGGCRLVSEAMGGAVPEDQLHEFPWTLHLSELKFHLQSNVVPIGSIRKGIYCHRALLFKVPVHGQLMFADFK